MKIKAMYKKGRLKYPIELCNVRGNPFTGRRDYRDAFTGYWISEKYIKHPKLLESVNERRSDMASATRSLFFNNYYWR